MPAVIYGWNMLICWDKIREPKNNSVVINCRMEPAISNFSCFFLPLGKNFIPSKKTIMPNGTLT